MLSRVFSSKDRGIYLVCSLAGYLVSLATKPAIWGPYAAMLVTYHLFLVSLLYLSEKKSSRSYSLPVTIAAHLGSLVLLVAVRLAVVTAILSALRSEAAGDIRARIVPWIEGGQSADVPCHIWSGVAGAQVALCGCTGKEIRRSDRLGADDGRDLFKATVGRGFSGCGDRSGPHRVDGVLRAPEVEILRSSQVSS